LAGASGWGAGFYDYPTSLWLPRLDPAGIQLGGGGNQFSVSVHWAQGKTVRVESATDPANPVWTPLAILDLADGSASLTDPESLNQSMRFYRAVEVEPAP